MALTILTPIMTSNTTPSGVVDADSFGFDSVDIAWVLFRSEDGQPVNINSRSLGTTAKDIPEPPHWLSYEFPSAVIVSSYQMAYGYRNPTDFALEGWNGVTWVALHTVVGGPIWDGSTANQLSQLYTLATPVPYLKYRLYITVWADVVDWYADLVGIAQLVLYGESPSIEVPPLNLPLSFTPVSAMLGDFVQVPAIDSGLSFNPPSIEVGPVIIDVPPLSISMTLHPPGFTLVPPTNLDSSTIYRVTLTGTNDLLLPVSSLQMRLRSTGQSFISVVVPDGNTYAAAIIANAAGELVIERGVRFADGETQYVELARATVDDVRDDGGGRNRSITLSARAALSWGASLTIEMTGVTYRASSNAGRRFRADLDLNLRPGDTALVGSESIVVDLITYIVSPKGETMEISEAV